MKRTTHSKYNTKARNVSIFAILCLLPLATHAFPVMEGHGVDTLSMETLFSTMPDSIIPYLSKNNRLDMMDFMKSKMTAAVENSFGQKTVMTDFTPDYIKVQLHKGCDLEMRRFSYVGNSHENTAVCVVFTFKEGEQNQLSSRILFYDTAWNRLFTKVRIPEFRQFWSADSLSEDEKTEMTEMEPSILIAAKVSPEEPTLELTPTVVAVSTDERKLFDRCKKKVSLYLRSLMEQK